MVTSRYAELINTDQMIIKEEDLTWSDDQVLTRITHCGLCQYDGAYFRGIIGTPPLRVGYEPIGIVEAVGIRCAVCTWENASPACSPI